MTKIKCQSGQNSQTVRVRVRIVKSQLPDRAELKEMFVLRAKALVV